MGPDHLDREGRLLVQGSALVVLLGGELEGISEACVYPSDGAALHG